MMIINFGDFISFKNVWFTILEMYKIETALLIKKAALSVTSENAD